MNPRYPIYIVSKGRWQSRLTAKWFEATRVPYKIIVEEQERDAYASVIAPAKVVVLDPEYQRRYNVLCDLAPGASKGSGPARNFAWDLAQADGHARHWVVDDNISFFARLNRNAKVPFGDGTCFRCMEDFVDRYHNVALAGPHYWMFAPHKQKAPPFLPNTRIYSCVLVLNRIPFRWRGRWNEDTILSIDVLKAKWCTVLFYAFLQYKQHTLSMPGGNTDELYKDGTLEKSRMLARVHPDVVKLTWKYNRPHHHVDYGKHFGANRLIKRSGVAAPAGVDEYGLEFVKLVRKIPRAAAWREHA